MRFFFRNRDEPRPLPRREHAISMTGRDYGNLDGDQVVLKFWLPESIENMVDELSSKFNTSNSDSYRQMLFVHLYGRYDLTGLLERQDYRFTLNSLPLFTRNISDTEPGPDNEVPPTQEKNVADAKVWMPRKMKDDLQILATRNNMKLSKYVRTVVVRQLTGHLHCDETDELDTAPFGYEEV